MKSSIAALSFAAVAMGEVVVPTSFGYHIDGLGDFSSSLLVDFTQTSKTPPGMYIPSYSIRATVANTMNRTYQQSNVVYNAGDSASLLLPGSADNYTSLGFIPMGGLLTTYNDVLYGTFRTVTKFSKAAGAYNTLQLYAANGDSTDLNYLTNKPGEITHSGTASSATPKTSSQKVTIPADATDAYHEYRVDWSPSGSIFFIDGVQVSSNNASVPSNPSQLVWSNWSNGNPATTGFPGNTTGDLRIRSITAYFNRTSAVTAYRNGPNMPCGTQPITYTYKTPSTTGNDLADFLGDTVYSSAASSAAVPSGYRQVFRNMVASVNSPRYLTVSWQNTYNVTACANICSGIANCQAFNIFAERNPTLNPGPGCTNPASLTNIKCTFFDGPLNYTDAVNWGEWRSSFGVVMAGSNAYNVGT